MALATSLINVARQLADAMEAVAQLHGLGPRDYRLFGTFQSEADHISLSLKTTKEVDTRKLYSDYFDKLRDVFSDDTSVPIRVGLVIRQKLDQCQVNTFGYWSESEDDITDLLNP